MTTIAYRSGLMAADSRVTTHTEEGGACVFRCEKLYRILSPKLGDCIVGAAGESFSALVFLDWLKTEKTEGVDNLILGEADFTALVLTRKGLFEYDKWCRGERVLDRFYAVGSGAKAALGAMHMGADSRQAVAVACRVDPYSAPPIVTMRLEGKGRAQPRGGAAAPERPAR